MKGNGPDGVHRGSIGNDLHFRSKIDIRAS
jgi:hypothetical protein